MFPKEILFHILYYAIYDNKGIIIYEWIYNYALINKVCLLQIIKMIFTFDFDIIPIFSMLDILLGNEKQKLYASKLLGLTLILYKNDILNLTELSKYKYLINFDIDNKNIIKKYIDYYINFEKIPCILYKKCATILPEQLDKLPFKAFECNWHYSFGSCSCCSFFPIKCNYIGLIDSNNINVIRTIFNNYNVTNIFQKIIFCHNTNEIIDNIIKLFENNEIIINDNDIYGLIFFNCSKFIGIINAGKFLNSKRKIMLLNDIKSYKQLNFNKKDLNIILRNNLNNLYDHALNAYTNKKFIKMTEIVPEKLHDIIRRNIYDNIMNAFEYKIIYSKYPLKLIKNYSYDNSFIQ